MKSRKIEIAPDVVAAVRQQMLFIARDSVDDALKWEDRIMIAIFGIADFHGHALDSEVGTRLGYPVHKIVFERTYLIHY